MTLEQHNLRMMKVVHAIEQGLGGKLSVEALSRIACYSPYHFHRLFRAYTGEAVYAFQKRLLLERAAHRLVYTDAPVTQVALDAGYDTPSAFNKAFQKRFNTSPGEFRKQKLMVSNFKPVTYCEDKTMTPEIKKFKKMNILRVRAQGSYTDAAEKAWGTLMGFMYSNRLMSKDTQLIGIPHDNPDITDAEHIRYDACVTAPDGTKADGEVQTGTIPAGTYAVFVHKGPYSGLDKTYGYIFGKWLPESGRTLKDQPCFERYLNRDPRRTKPDNLRTEVCVPIQ